MYLGILLLVIAWQGADGTIRASLHRVSGLGLSHHPGLSSRTTESLPDFDVAGSKKDKHFGTEDLVDFYNNFYVVRLLIGSPPQKLWATVDTGSSDLWVLDGSCPCDAPHCRSDQALCHKSCDLNCCDHNSPPNRCDRRNVFHSSNSSTYRSSGSDVKLWYNDGTLILGHLGSDVCRVGNIEIPHQSFVSATITTGASGDLDGVLGLAYPSMSKTGTDPPVQSMIRQGLISKPIFSVWMEEAQTGTVGGEITFGESDATKYTGPITYVPVTVKGYWQYRIDRVQFGWKSFTKLGSYKATSDTGTTFIRGPISVIKDICKEAGGTMEAIKEWTKYLCELPCSSAKELPSIKFVINGNEFAIDAEDYVHKPMKGSQGHCYLMLGQHDNYQEKDVDWVLGDGFIRSWYHIFDFGKDRIGLARSIRDNQTRTIF